MAGSSRGGRSRGQYHPTGMAARAGRQETGFTHLRGEAHGDLRGAV